MPTQGVVGFDFQRPTSEQLITLKSKGYDAILTGSITHYYGGYSKTTFMAELKFIDTLSGSVIWEGYASGGAKTQYSGLNPNLYRITDESLKNAVTSLVEQLENTSFQ